MLTRANHHSYQVEMINHGNLNPKAMIWGFLGSGKSITTLTTIVDRMSAGQVKKTLIIAPLRVCYTVWIREATKWTHTNHLTFSVIHGTREERVRAFHLDSDIYLINYEGLVWLTEFLLNYYVNRSLPIPFQMCVYDEISMTKNSESVRMKETSRREVEDAFGNASIEIKKGWRNICDMFSYTIGLTGTPSSNGYIDLFGQYLVIDGGERLFSKITHYRDSFFTRSFNGFGYQVTELGKKAIEERIADITLSLNNASDYLDLPKVTIKNMFVELQPKARKIYDAMEEQMFVAFDNGTEVEVFNKATLSNKCLQICNGSIYTDLEGNFEHIHDEKLKALEEVMEEAAGSPVLVIYNFTVNANAIMKKFKKYKPVNLTEENVKNTGKIVSDWNHGKVKMIVGHSRSMGHGLDGLQQSGSIVVWIGINWNLEYYLQTNGRVDRQGQTKPVSIIRILASNTVDMAVANAIDHKFETQEDLKNSIAKYRTGGIAPDLKIDFL